MKNLSLIALSILALSACQEKVDYAALAEAQAVENANYDNSSTQQLMNRVSQVQTSSSSDQAVTQYSPAPKMAPAPDLSNTQSKFDEMLANNDGAKEFMEEKMAKCERESKAPTKESCEIYAGILLATRNKIMEMNGFTTREQFQAYMAED